MAQLQTLALAAEVTELVLANTGFLSLADWWEMNPNVPWGEAARPFSAALGSIFAAAKGSPSDPGIPENQNWDQSTGHRCPRCGKRYRWKGNLTRHVNFECGKQPRFKCSYCGIGVTQKTSMQRHLFTCAAARAASSSMMAAAAAAAARDDSSSAAPPGGSTAASMSS